MADFEPEKMSKQVEYFANFPSHFTTKLNSNNSYLTRTIYTLYWSSFYCFLKDFLDGKTKESNMFFPMEENENFDTMNDETFGSDSFGLYSLSFFAF